MLGQATVEDLDYGYALNVRAAVILIKAFAPGMREAKFGRIVNISSRAILGKTHRTVYSAGKAALAGITRTLCLEPGGAMPSRSMRSRRDPSQRNCSTMTTPSGAQSDNR